MKCHKFMSYKFRQIKCFPGPWAAGQNRARLLLLCLTGLLGASLIGPSGCSTEHYKSEADEEVYGIIDRKWQEDFGSKANYRISDVEPSPNDIQVTPPVTGPTVLNLAEAVALTTANNREYQRQKEDLYLTALDLTSARNDFTAQWFGLLDADYAKDSNDESVGYEAEFGFGQLLADGAIITTGIALDWLRFLTGDPRTSLASVLTATVTQPLLRGSGRRIVQENLTQAERDVLYELRTFGRFRKTFVVSIVGRYYRVLQLLDAVKNAENNYNNLALAQERVEMLALAGRLPRFEVHQAQQNKLRAWDSVVRARQRYKQALDEFKLVLALPTDFEMQLDADELAALRTVEISEPNYDVGESIETALNQRLDFATERDLVADAGRKVELAADNLGPELNLVGSASVRSKAGTDFTRLQFHKGVYSAGLQLDLPFERTAERNAYRQALITLTRQERRYVETADEIKLDVRQAYRQLQEAVARYRIQLESLKLAQRRVESTSLLLQAGRATTRDLLESQDALLEAQNKLTSALVDYTIAKLDFFRDTGVLQVRPDGLWEY